MSSAALRMDVTGIASYGRALRGGSIIAIVLVTLSIALVGCGTPAASAKSPGNGTSATSIAVPCQEVTAALSDGPDESEDPVGYAEAQVRPLRTIVTSDAALRAVIDRLASSYETVVKAGAGKTAESAVAAAQDAVGKFCPGVTS